MEIVVNPHLLGRKVVKKSTGMRATIEGVSFDRGDFYFLLVTHKLTFLSSTLDEWELEQVA